MRTFAQCFLMKKADQRRETRADLRDYRTSSRTAGGGLLFLFKSAETLTSYGYCRISHRTGIHSGTESSSRPCLSFLRFWGAGDRVRLVLTLGGAPFRAHLAERGFADRMLFSPSRLNDGGRFLGTLSAAGFAAPLARSGCRRQPKLRACRYGQHTVFLATRFG